MKYLVLILFVISCTETNVPLPKPRIYPKVTFPVKEYIKYQNNDCPFEMSIPKYFKFNADTKKIKSEEKFSCWFDLHSNELNTNIHFSYLSFNDRQGLDKLVEDAFVMADKHNIKASYRNEIKINKPEKNIYGIIFNIDGPVASPTQFFLTDSTQHFLRGSLYFNDVVNRDSIAPVYDYLQDDFTMLFDSFVWK